MRIRQNALAVLYHEEPDRVPWLPSQGVLPAGSLERRLRNKGMGLEVGVPVHSEVQPHVRVEEKREASTIHRTYRTPLGELSTLQTLDYSPNQESKHKPWTMKYMIESVADFEVAKFMIEDTYYVPNYKPFLKTDRWIGDDGLVTTGCPRSPFQKILVEFTGYKNGILLYYRYPKEFEELRRVIEKKQDEVYRIVADSPASVVILPSNIDGVMINPKLFEKYYAPFYNRQASLMHKSAKLFGCHMDGRLGILKDLIAQTDLDIIQAFTPAPMFDLSIAQAKAAWKDKVIWVNFPETVCLYGVDELRDYTIELLRGGAPGCDFIVGLTETVPAQTKAASFIAITEVIANHGRYPLRKI